MEEEREEKMEMGMKMKTVPNKQIVLNEYVKGYPKESDFVLKYCLNSCSLPIGSSEGGVLVKNLYLACDPYMRHRMSNTISHPTTILHSFSPGSVLVGYGVAKIIHSTHPDFKEGDFVWRVTGWEEYTLILNTTSLTKIKCTHVPLSYYAGIPGMPGIAAYVGFINFCSPKKGETVYVSSGSTCWPICKVAGCYVVGSASTKEKVDIVKKKFGFDDAFNYKEEHDLGATLKRHFPEGIDIYFENVGGKMLDEVLLHMKAHGRIAACGMISQINLAEEEGIHNLFSFITKRLQMKGFIETDMRELYPQYLEFAKKNLEERKLVYVEDIAEGLEKASAALVGIFYGNNVGKEIIRVACE